MSEAREFYEKIGGKMEKMKKDAPAMSAGFGGLFSKVMVDAPSAFEKRNSSLWG